MYEIYIMICLFLLDIYDVQNDPSIFIRRLWCAEWHNMRNEDSTFRQPSFVFHNTHTHEAKSGPANKHACRCNSKAASTRRALNYRWAPTTGTTGLGGVADKARGRQVIELQVRRSDFSMHETRERKRNNKKTRRCLFPDWRARNFYLFYFQRLGGAEGGGGGGTTLGARMSGSIY